MSKSDAVVSLFSGAGGFSAGFSQAGLKPLFGADINADACQTYQLNIGSPCHQLDLSTVEPSYIEKLAGGNRPFVVIGGPPCQGFSTAGPEIQPILATSLSLITSISLRGYPPAGSSLRMSRGC